MFTMQIFNLPQVSSYATLLSIHKQLSWIGKNSQKYTELCIHKIYNNPCLRCKQKDPVAQRKTLKMKSIIIGSVILFWRSESDHIKTRCQTFPSTICSPLVVHLLAAGCTTSWHHRHKPLNKQLTRLCKTICSDGLWETFIVRPALLWHAHLKYQCSLLPLMFPQSIFFGPAVSSLGGQISSYG